jgi:small subunit ribosomal protein S1
VNSKTKNSTSAKGIAGKQKSKTRSPQNTPEPSSMDELLKGVTRGFHVYRRGDKVEGTITEITPKSLYLDVGGKSEAMVVDKEYELAKDMIRQLKVGNSLEAVVVVSESDSGHMLLSLKRAASDRRWGEMERILKADEALEVTGKEIVKGGLLVETDGMSGFIPGSQLGREWSGQPESLIGKKFPVKVLEVDRISNRLVFSEKVISEAEELMRTKENLLKVKIGEVYSGTVTTVMPFGIFVKIRIPISDGKTKKGKKPPMAEEMQELEGLVHVSELAWAKTSDPKAVVKEGDGVKVKVIGVEENEGRLALSVKQTQPDPWLEAVKKYPVDTKVKGKVTRLASFGAFVELPGGIEGLMHISKIPAEVPIKPGDEIECFVETVDVEKRRLGLGLVLKAKPVMYK